ncbi:TonB-linked outer membrane protein, SusC/RagA family [Chitinophaga terrae (ex Kim and Jung 2007)]|uniref:TonB-linked outer membrane protein, SusC/RagA family n=1 Tax=Chitinophaga terrae (ex Kim and Jung 2007) TaxID=408074 RepID=A0A1H3XE93_9BACT|nr:TonB-dependent receptor [Chitinophaga terrae (ex Kim and Jung 2007)]MDQ0108894.1 TonB-linked SusC/RagA family outer membrane protein [Chitinophaga terrae (ex Kim and Jung 2007)]GEP89802.1 SusC/RagA family TonB-linked outer membrane protein [Chitinophaga terrae (ex Kim and Jung 2007)]SDZ97004.1 TonB-linked outer membrane protein, SusC/RagA family [Chitinophaga terrae (ex Kim and Jung 2007)]
MKRWLHTLLLLGIVVQGAAQSHTVNGKVSDEHGQPLPGVSVKIRGTSSGTSTDTKGNFTLNAGANDWLIFSFIGFKNDTVAVGNRTSFQVILKDNVTSLNDLVVVGYGTQKKVNLTGAVSQVTGKVLENRPLPNLSQGLQGVIPNLNLIPGDGKPISSPAYNVRGVTSIGQGGNALILIDGVEGDPSMLNPSDVASVSVLKDASSAAIYGARAAFGVVLITTKTPTKDRTSISVSSNYSSKSPTTVPNMVSNGYEYVKNFYEAWTAWNDYSQNPTNINKTQPFSLDYLNAMKAHNDDPSLPKTELINGNYVYYGNTDWYDLLYKKHLGATDQNISVSGSSGKASYYVTGRYYGQGGLFRYNSDDYRMYNLRAKGNIQLFPFLQVYNNTEFSSRDYHNPLNTGEGGGIWRNLADEGHPSSMLFNPDGTLTQSAAYTVGDFVYGKNGFDFNRRLFRNTTGFIANIYKDQVRLKGDFTVQNTNDNNRRIRVPVPYSPAPGVTNYVGAATNDLQRVANTTLYTATNIYAEYERNLEGGHYFKILGGLNYEMSTFKGFSTTRNGLVYPDAKDLSLALGSNVTTDGGYDRWAVMGEFFRLNYSFKDRYLLEVNGRYDGSSKFPSNQRYAFFPSVSAGWRVNKEAFWKMSPNAISDLKIRGSYGSLGNGNIESYAYQEKLKISQSGRVINGAKNQQTGQPVVLPDGLTWETATTADIGLDLAALNDRITFTGDYYNRVTKNMFTVGQTLPAIFGTDVPKGNYADLKTNGWEISLGWKDKFNVASKPLNYNVTVTLADARTTITKYNNTNNKLTDWYAGQRYGQIWGYVNDGYWTKDNVAYASKMQSLFKASNSGQWLPGDIKFKDLNGDSVINKGANTLADHGDLAIIGDSAQHYTFGISLNADWNNFFVGVFFQGVMKQDWWPGSESDVFWGQYNRPYNYMPQSQVGKIWSEDNPDAYFPRYRGYTAQNGAGVLNPPQSKYLQNAAYIRLRNVQIGYNIPKSWISRAKINAARVYVSAENIWSWSPMYRITRDLDPESIRRSDTITDSGNSGNGNNYPILKSWNVGLNITL